MLRAVKPAGARQPRESRGMSCQSGAATGQASTATSFHQDCREGSASLPRNRPPPRTSVSDEQRRCIPISGVIQGPPAT